MKKSKKFKVRGKVQGVWYRAFAQETALSLAISGYAKNMRDGSVEVLLQGEEESLAQMEKKLWQGSPGSQVESVEEQELTLQEDLEGFEII